MAAYHPPRGEEGLVSERKSRPRLRVIAGGGAGSVPKDRPARQDPPSSKLRTRPQGAAPAPLVQKAALPPASRRAPEDEELCPRYYEGQHERRAIAADVDRLRYAIVDLASIELPPSRLLAEIDPTFDKPIIRDRLIRAIDCLSQFAEEWRLEELTAAARASRGADEES